MNDALSGKNVLVTGASRGLGREIAGALWRAGASVLLAARSATPLSELQAELMQTARAGQTAHVVVVDLRSPDAVKMIVDECRRHWDRVDVLVNNAAVLGPVGRAWENDWTEWQTALRVNLLAPVALCRALVPWMIERGGGKVLNLSGGGATAPRPYFSAYATAKAALVRFSETLALEVKDRNVQVNCIAPGAMNTEMNRAVLQAGAEKAGNDEYARATRLALDKGLPTRAAELCVYLAGSRGDGITGRLLSAKWDPWQKLPEHMDELKESDIYTLRRIVPQDRGYHWE
ncbi:MAG: SDR family NAD(P)-dependent oxidoreductase [Acidobacteriota bacterium]